MALRECPDCKEQVSDAAPACPKCGRPMPDAKPPKKKLSKVQWALIIVVGIIILGVIGSRGGNRPAKTGAEVAQDKAERKAASQEKKIRERMERQIKEAEPETGLDADCTATQLHREYKANEVSADAKYKGKWVRVRGKLLSVAKGLGDAPYLALAADGYGIAQVQAHLFEVQAKSLEKETFATSTVAEAAGALKVGQNVTVECLGQGVMLTIPQLDQCIIVPSTTK